VPVQTQATLPVDQVRNALQREARMERFFQIALRAGLTTEDAYGSYRWAARKTATLRNALWFANSFAA
jgi:hypothetical protein